MRNLLAHLFSIGRTTLVKDDKDVQLMQVSQGQYGSDNGESITDDIPVIGLFGFSSSAPERTEILLLRLGGDRSQSVAIGSNHRPSRPKNLKTGDTKVYDVRGAYIWLSEDGIVIDAATKHVIVQNADTVTVTANTVTVDADTVTVKATTKVRLETPKVETTGDLVSRCDGTPVSLNALRDAYHAHKHTGVQTGTGTSGPTDHDA